MEAFTKTGSFKTEKKRNKMDKTDKRDRHSFESLFGYYNSVYSSKKNQTCDFLLQSTFQTVLAIPVLQKIILISNFKCLILFKLN